MKLRTKLISAGVLILGACTVPVNGNDSGDTQAISNLPEEILAIAGPKQYLTSVRYRAEDGCYWYKHVGVVETVMLPLRSTSGQPICSSRGPAT